MLSRSGSMHKLIVLLVLSALVLSGQAQDSTLVKLGLAGTKLVVPDSCSWRIERVFISCGDNFNIQVSTNHFKPIYAAKEDLILPLYIAEMELLTNRAMVSYTLNIIATKE